MDIVTLLLAGVLCCAIPLVLFVITLAFFLVRENMFAEAE